MGCVLLFDESRPVAPLPSVVFREKNVVQGYFYTPFPYPYKGLWGLGLYGLWDGEKLGGGGISSRLPLLPARA